MKKIYTYFFLINTFYIINCYADNWTLVSHGENISVYIDENTINSKDDIVVWWQLDSYSEKFPDIDITVYSNIARSEGDCLRGGRRDLYITYYDQEMGKGNKVHITKNPDKEWVYYEPGSVYYKILMYACEKINSR